MDSPTDQTDLKHSIINKSTILYVEDENILREEISNLLQGFFQKVFIASNGEEALALYEKNKIQIDIILTDINMPKMNGIELISQIRQKDMNLPILICTAFNESKILIKAIKLGVSDYIIKPLQMITTLKICAKILTIRKNELLVEKQMKELEDLKSILEDENFIIETNLEHIITHVNPLLCKASGYEEKELLGQRNSILKHPDTSKTFADNLWKTINSGEKWQGKIKNLAKDGSTFYTKTTILPIFNENGDITKFLSTGTLITSEEEEKQNLKRLILQHKGEKLKYESNIQQKIQEEVNNALANSSNQRNEENKKLIQLVNDLDEEIKRLRNKNIDNNSRVFTSEKKLQDTMTRFDNMQIAYQKKISGMNSTIQTLAKKFEDLIKKTKLTVNKLEKSQDSISILQGYIDDYRKKISDLEDVIASYEKELQELKSNKY
ncbi:putative PAS/PAC sensor protein [Arcobacter nitrofigilis DSM 7299]|uniref:Putative PAS/PAC sensor protein n=1 Tax=Arcobacter nitrofigilis (strain ATCC 33309 / DSM 7299 / CCUG 15893 / LMG 7604 / NCTC 12251 / CI) TaxID=572480 RepID=D5UZU7_ARCNC|nr:response regulator [Arcobacter nitrofigilis]ADG93316.1 putative PAS/PAC sensor protein [Arcobacter nitrofigilis DSM 7299]